MIKVFVSHQSVEVEALKEFLEQEGIPCVVKNQYTASLAGEVPFAEVFPELWILRDADLSRAEEIVKIRTQERPTDMTFWTCKKCGERHPGQFTGCWRCGTQRRG